MRLILVVVKWISQNSYFYLEAYLIEDGKVTTPISATLIGNGPDVMGKISMIGNDMHLDRGVGVCGKDGQSVPVGVMRPSVDV